MPAYHLKHLGRDAYIASIANIKDTKTIHFANMSLAWWDDHHLWHKQGCIVLCDAQDIHLSYLFYRTDRYRQYLHIHNLFTPLAKRRHGHAYTLLDMIFLLASEQNIKRFKLTSISKSLDFYLALGLIYWGVNSVGDFYCDLPMPEGGLEGLDIMVRGSDTAMLIGKSLESIYAKVAGNADGLNVAQRRTYNADLLKLGSNYRFDALLALRAA